MTWADRLALRDEANRRVRVLTALAGAGSVAGTGVVLVAVAGSGSIAAPSTALAAPQTPTRPARHVPAALLTTKHHARHRAAVPATVQRIRQVKRVSVPSAPRHSAAPVAPKHVVHRARPAPAPATSPSAAPAQPSPQPTDSSSSGCCSHSGGSH